MLAGAVSPRQTQPSAQPRILHLPEPVDLGPVTARDIEAFTEITGDHKPIHYDEELAKSSRFGGIVVQGGVTSGLLNALVAEQLPGPGSVFLEVAWRFPAPVRPRDVITVLDGTAVVWRDPAVAALLSAEALPD